MKNSQRITFMGTPEIAVPYLKSLLDNKFNVVAVYSQPARPKDRGMNIKLSPVQIFAEKNKIPLFTPSILNNVNEVKRFEELKNDLVIIMGYGIFLPENFISKSKLGCINIHLSLLPKWRGASPIEHTLLAGENETGVTIFKLNKKFDSGPILSSQKILIVDSMTKNQLQEKLNYIGTQLLIKTLPKYFLGKLKLRIQNERKASYAPKIKSRDRKINFFQNANVVYNKVRAFSPKPGAWITLKNERIKILSCAIDSRQGKASTVISKDLLIGCKDKSIRPLIIQREGRKSMKIEDFLKGFPVTIGNKVNLNAQI